MNDLIPLHQNAIAGETVPTVNARELHAFLESKQKFADWIKGRIEQYEFTQDVDFAVIHSFMNDDSAFGGKRKTIEYHLTLDMAKELSMVERNAKGKEARRYFIECERQAKEAAKPKRRTDALLEMVLAMRAVEIEQERLAEEQAKMEAEQHRLQAQMTALTDGEDYMTIVGYGLLIGERMDMSRAAKLGRIAARLCREAGYYIGKAHHPIFGKINAYPRVVVAQAFDLEGIAGH